MMTNSIIIKIISGIKYERLYLIARNSGTHAGPARTSYNEQAEMQLCAHFGWLQILLSVNKKRL